MSSSLYYKKKIFPPKKSENNNDLIIEKSITYSTTPKLMNKSLIRVRQIYDKKKLNQKLNFYNRKNSLIINKPEKLIFKRKLISISNTQSQNTSLTLKNSNNNSYSINNDNHTFNGKNSDKYYKIRINLMKRKKDNIINNENKNNTSHWRSMSIGFNDFNLSNRKHDYSYISENENNLKKIILIQSFFRRFLIRKLIFNQLIKYFKQNNAVLNMKNILIGIFKKIFFKLIELIKLRKNAKYYINYKEYELLIELHRRNIYSKNDWIIYFNKLINGNLITENKTINKKK